MNSIDEEGEKLLWIMLSVAREHFVNISDRRFYPIRSINTLFFAPHIFYEQSISLSKLSLRSNRIIKIDLINIFLVQEILSQRQGMWKTLETTIHKTSISQVLQSNKASPTSFPHVHLYSLLCFLFLDKFAALDMIFSIILITILGTIWNCFTSALDSQFFVLVARFTLSLVCACDNYFSIFYTFQYKILAFQNI